MIPILRFLVIIIAVSLLPSIEGWPGKKKKEEEERPRSFDMGLKSLQETMRDPAALREALAMAKDPEIMREVEALMEDPSFQAEMDKLMQTKDIKDAMSSAQQMAKDPKKLDAFKEQVTSLMAEANRQQNYSGKQNAQLGLQTLASTMQDPTAMADAMNMLKDPATAKEVETMMKDPNFQAEMRRITEDPAFKGAMKRAEKITDELKSDPVRAKEFMRELEGAMSQFRKEL